MYVHSSIALLSPVLFPYCILYFLLIDVLFPSRSVCHLRPTYKIASRLVVLFYNVLQEMCIRGRSIGRIVLKST